MTGTKYSAEAMNYIANFVGHVMVGERSAGNESATEVLVDRAEVRMSA